MNDWMKIEIEIDGEWIPIEFLELKPNDKFRMKDPDNGLVAEISGYKDWVCDGLPYFGADDIPTIVVIGE